MKNLDVNEKKFYNMIDNDGELLFEHVEGWDEEGNHYEYYGFEDALNECVSDMAKLHDYGKAYYYYDGKIYLISVYLPNFDGAGVNILEVESDKEEIKGILTILFNQYDINPDNPFEDEDMLGYLIDDKPWAKKYFSLFQN